jgi:hypothetical protein
MKTKSFLALTLILTMCFGNQVAFAAPSPTAADTTILANAVTVSSTSGSATALDLETLTAANNAARELVANIISSAQTTAESTVNADGTLVLTDEDIPLGTSAEPELLAAFDFTPSDSVKAEIQKKGKAEVTFQVADVKFGDNIKVLHLKKDGTWETIDPSSVKDGEVTASFTEFSPVVITKITPEVANLEKTSKGVNFYVVVAITLLGVAAIALVFALGNKKKVVKRK